MRLIVIVFLLSLAGLSGTARSACAAEITVFAAASTRGALEEAAAAFEAAQGHALRIAPAGSSLLARQIDRGAPADLFLSANPDWMDWLAARGHVRTETRVTLLGNRLVLIAPRQAGAASVTLKADALLEALGPEGRIAMALSDAVPAGLYTRAAFETLGLWEALAPRRVEADNVRAALALVALGEAPLGVVYASDAAAEPRVRVVAEIPDTAHPPIRYPAAILRDAPAPEAAAAFLDWLQGPEARAIFDAHGFAAPQG
ncbi:molybdate transport system substrate-binding protein [Roseivivax lentus]|uniref:Molybdate transport system substrate-binding protein n=1 Tax=Roseivivax lentus TaxID=633194 RepID=A0A1N7L6P1_9RHOB|nr:molybdate ABC transporter substrate-binding protein [Roseivivax lentus]SIS69456.1 molybdate transport system substrate-binding protein [Roseivivax lentus]